MHPGETTRQAGWARRRWLLPTAGLPLLVMTSGVVWPAVFLAFGVHGIQPMFSDLIAILAAGEAAHGGWDVYASNPLDPLNRPHVYGPWWLATGRMGLVRADAWWIGLLLVFVFVIVAAVVLSPRNRRAALIGMGLMASPPVLLGMERGNNDLMMFLLLAASAWLVTRATKWAPVFAAGLLVLAAALKLYPLVALPSLAARAAPRRRVILLVGLAVLACGVIAIISFADYRRVVAMAPQPLSIFAYGGKLSYYLWLTIPQQRDWLLAGGLPVLGFFLWSSWHWRRDYWRMLPLTGFTTACYLAGALCWILCYAGTINFPYRMVLLLLPARLWLDRVNAGRSDLVGWVQCLATMLLFWTPVCKDRLLSLSPDEHMFGGPPLAWMAIGMEHALAFGVTATLGLVALGWLWRRFQPEAEN